MALKDHYKKVSNDYHVAKDHKLIPNATAVKIEGFEDFEFFIKQEEIGGIVFYSIYEAHTGGCAAVGYRTKQEAIKTAGDALRRNLKEAMEAYVDILDVSIDEGYRMAFEDHIKEMVGEYGLSPRYIKLKEEEN